MSQTYITVAGNVASEPTVRVTQNGHTVVVFRLAQNHRRALKDGTFVDTPTNWYSVTAWRGLASNVSTAVAKGDPVVVHGRLRVQEGRDKDDKPRTYVDIEALSIGHDLRWGTTSFTKVTRATAPETPEESEARGMQVDTMTGEVIDAPVAGSPALQALESAAAAVGGGAVDDEDDLGLDDLDSVEDEEQDAAEVRVLATV